MPGSKGPHHSDKWRSCVEKVMAQGHDQSSASAICTTALEKAGEDIFMAAEDGLRHLHVLGATGAARVEMHDGREHLVVPVVALMEGVIHAVNARSPEFVPLATLKKAAASWDGKPVTLGHPKGKDGKQCSASDAAILAAHGIGVVKRPRVEGTKLLCEAWIDKAKAKRLDPDMYARLLDGEREEVSVGAFVVTNDAAGEHGGRSYRASWGEASGDHLAFLPGGRGACSIDMGCGAHRAAMHLVTAEGYEMRTLEEHALDLPGIVAFTTLEGESLNQRIMAVDQAVRGEWNDPPTQPDPYAFLREVFDAYAIVQQGEDTWSVPYTIDKDGNAVLGKATKVKQAYVAAKAKMQDCPACNGSGNVGNNPCDVCDGAGELKAAAGARHSASDMKAIQAVHDHAMALGATCDRANYKMLRDISQKERDALPSEDFAGKGTSFPIKKPGDVAAAASSIGRAGADNYSTDVLKANIIRIAYQKGATFVAELPDAWKKKADQRAASAPVQTQTDPNRFYIERVKREAVGAK